MWNIIEKGIKPIFLTPTHFLQHTLGISISSQYWWILQWFNHFLFVLIPIYPTTHLFWNRPYNPSQPFVNNVHSRHILFQVKLWLATNKSLDRKYFVLSSLETNKNGVVKIFQGWMASIKRFHTYKLWNLIPLSFLAINNLS